MKIKVSFLRKIIREVLEEEAACLDEKDGESGKGIEADTDGDYHNKQSNRNPDKDTQYDRK
jgi:hypothetical protein